MSALPHRLDRTVVIRASREIVFSFFTDSDRWASWWGAGSTVGKRPGEPIYIRYPGGVEVAGEIVELEPPTRIVFTYGFISGNPIPPGASLATITLEREGDHTRLHLVHEFADAATRDHHIQGWRYQLSVFANAVADHLHRDVNTIVDAWFNGWTEIDRAARERTLGAVSRPNITFHDRHSAIDGLADLTAHIGAYHTFMPNVTLARRGEVRHCQGVVLADWVMTGADGKEQGSGTNVFQLGTDGLIESVTGLWAAARKT